MNRRTWCQSLLFGSLTLWAPFSWAQRVALSYPSQTDVVIVGAGCAGLTAAIRAAQAGASVVVIDKMPTIGGNTILAHDYFFSIPNNETSTVQKFTMKLMTGPFKTLSEPLLSYVVRQSSYIPKWLDDLGMKTERLDKRFPTHVSVAEPLVLGEELIQTLARKAESLGVKIFPLTQCKGFVMEDHRLRAVKVMGVDGKEMRINTRAVVLATGGYAANAALTGMSKDGGPPLLDTTNLPSTMGEGLQLAQTMAAKRVLMQQVVKKPTCVPLASMLFSNQLLRDGAVLLDPHGHRFVDELDPKLVDKLTDYRDMHMWLVFSQPIYEENPFMASYVRLKHVQRFTSLDRMARYMRVNRKALEEALLSGKEPQGLVTNGMSARRAGLYQDGPYYAVQVHPAVHRTLGGLVIDSRGRVLHQAGYPVDGLFAAGDVVGGLYSNDEMDGMGITLAIILGDLAGESAAQFAIAHP